jgi:hypothetical protein
MHAERAAIPLARVKRTRQFRAQRRRETPARGRAACRRRESLGTDSRVLRLERAVNTPAKASGAKLFSYDESGRRAAVARSNTRMCAACRVRARHEIAARAMNKTQVSSALLQSHRFALRARVAENFFGAASRRQSRRAHAATAGQGRSTQNQAKSLLFFFCCSNPMVVHVDSRLHCTYVAIHSSLGGQQWRRSERRRQRRRSRRRRRQDGRRRNSQRRDRSSTSHVSKIASHGPAEVEGGSMISRDWPAQVDDRGRRRDGGENVAVVLEWHTVI